MIKFLSSVVAFCFVAATAPADAQSPSDRGVMRKQAEIASNCGRIVGGECANPGAWPWQVALFARAEAGKDFHFHCGGSLSQNDGF